MTATDSTTAAFCASRNPKPPHQRCEQGAGHDGRHRDFPTDPTVAETYWTDAPAPEPSDRAGWMRDEHERAKARNAEVPPHARLRVTGGLLADLADTPAPEPSDRAGLSETLADLFAEHEEDPGWTIDDHDRPVYECQCGDRSPALDSDAHIGPEDVEAAARWHRLHLAQMVVRIVAEVDAGVEQEVAALRAECEKWRRRAEGNRGGHLYDQVVADRDTLRDKVADLRETETALRGEIRRSEDAIAKVEEIVADRDALRAQVAAVEALLPTECWISRTPNIRCIDYVGGAFPDGSPFAEDACCLPCRLRAALGDSAQVVQRIKGEAAADAWDSCLQALAWAMGNGRDPIEYLVANNPYRERGRRALVSADGAPD